jgi:hypothetical protein
MSFFSSIGKALGGFVHKATHIADVVTGILKKPLDFVTKPLSGLVGKICDKLPFGIGSFIKPYAQKFLSMGINWLAAGPLGGFMATLQQVSGIADKVDSVLHTVDGALNGGVASLPAPAKQNAQEGFAFAQAQELFA